MISWLEKLVGKENVSDEIIEREVYSTDASQIKGKTDKVIWPETVKHIHQIVLYTRRNKKNIVLRGAGTNFVGSVVPQNSLVLDFTKMNKILSFTKDSVVVEPGVVLDDLNEFLQKRNKFFPVVPEDSAVCTIGGMCGVNSFSIYEKKFGRMKDWVLEVEMIDGHGKLRRQGNEVIGFEGILGIITKVKLKIIDKIIEKSMNVFKCANIEEALSKVSSLRDNPECISVEFISPTAALLSGLEHKAYLIVEYLGFEGEIMDEQEMRRIWSIRKDVFHKLASKGFTLLEDPSLPLENMPELLYWLEKKGIPSFGPICSGILHPCFSERESSTQMYQLVLQLKGTTGKTSGIGLLKKDFLSEVSKAETISLKKRFDPDNILNRGKVIEWQE